MNLSRTEIADFLEDWNKAWNNHELESVMAFFHDEIYFENWTGGYAKGKKKLREGWRDWFLNHGDFVFITKLTYSKTTLEIDGKRVVLTP